MYARRRIIENVSNVNSLPLPPIRRTFVEVFNEWQDDWLNQERLLFVMFLLTIFMQFCIIMTLSLIFHQYQAPPDEAFPLMRMMIMALLRVFGLGRMIPQLTQSRGNEGVANGRSSRWQAPQTRME